jgi:S-DNA-T family DNA segregation ATPase FtsK/SpoIIIE
VTQIKIGPAVTQYEIQPAQGVKVSKIVAKANAISLCKFTILLTLTP